ncbi:glycerophosphodiester phosphodiesterase [Brachybacterium sp. EF45031]|uniref:glycerophosphodiester phosphodiesterase family protein n=1 Tax=Brachybacterium sillae TaxID=2810536 RepID=UPI00217F146D|nr:glycerophosphodiester phosphodiesterase family protein [Brachybacterium sillae]MCS6710656.1 glycerophosphodiester phosphodiesterase [Brachybacterium sillae]
MPFSTAADTDGTRTPRSRFGPGPRPRVIAHRGLALDGAENTLRAFSDALAAGADMLETDTRASSDGTAYALHDETMRRVAGDPRPVAALTAAQLSRMRIAGAEPPAALADVLGSFRDVIVNIDVKDARSVLPAAQAIARTGAVDRVCVTSFDDRVALRAVAQIRRLTGRTPRRSPSRGGIALALALWSVEAPEVVLRRALRPYQALQVPMRHGRWRIVTPRSVAAAHRAGCEVHVWTIDTPAGMREVLALGVDGIVTNRADLLAGFLARR